MVESDLMNKNLLSDQRPGNFKTQIVPVQTKTLQHLPKRPAVDLAFHNLTYRVKEGNRSSKYLLQLTFKQKLSQSNYPLVSPKLTSSCIFILN